MIDDVTEQLMCLRLCISHSRMTSRLNRPREGRVKPVVDYTSQKTVVTAFALSPGLAQRSVAYIIITLCRQLGYSALARHDRLLQTSEAILRCRCGWMAGLP